MSDPQLRNPLAVVVRAITDQFRPLFRLVSRTYTQDDFTLWPPPPTDAQPPDAPETALAADLRPSQPSGDHLDADRQNDGSQDGAE